MSFKDGPLAQNRTEELGYDLWKSFVLPPYFENLDILNSKKPKVIVGGRGCGKTMLLRYLSHSTKFSISRKSIDRSEILHIGLYWRVDTQFASLMNKRGLDDEVWQNAFEHLACLLISNEILKSLSSIAKSSFDGVSEISISQLRLDELRPFDHRIPSNILEFSKHIKKQIRHFQSWLNNIKKTQEPIFYPRSFIDSLIDEIQSQIPELGSSSFYVYLDEYENLIGYQKRLVNTWVKHSEPPLIFNLAMKKNSFHERRTIGNEQISDIHDFRVYPIEEYLWEDDFEVFAAEILFLRFYYQGLKDVPIDPDFLKDVNKIGHRKEDKYKESIRSKANQIFPESTREKLVDEIFSESNLYERFEENLSKALGSKNSKRATEEFIDQDFKEASLINTCLIYRDKPGVELVLSEFQKLQAGNLNKYTGQTGWINNNFYGTYLMFFEPLNRPCKFYSGYSTFCSLSRGNIRYVLELCHKSLIRGEISDSLEEKGDSLKVDLDKQADAAKQVSKAFLEEVKTYGKLGNNLYMFVLRLGSIFHHAHKRLTQSEPEQNHFSLDNIDLDEGDYLKEFLNEAIKWSVLIEEKSTKEKAEAKTDFNEYILNPIYAPYFHISYRKKRKLTFSKNEFEILVTGSADNYDQLLKAYLKKWSLPENSTGSLFPNY
ncbi:hypothetical protein [Marinoscillum sp.]|uniref:ORC-CDC6 family AAA ATPase n=1 Tax=Marinoscillum sp. TaxID=2024838 RepID=UPI003BA865BC